MKFESYSKMMMTDCFRILKFLYQQNESELDMFEDDCYFDEKFNYLI